MAVYHLDCAQLKEAAPSCARAIVFCFPARLIPQGTRRINGLRRRLRRENHCPLRLRGGGLLCWPHTRPGSFADRELWADDLRPDGCLYS